MQEIFLESYYLNLHAAEVLRLKDFTQPHGVTDKDRLWRFIKENFAYPVLNYIKYLLLQRSSQNILTGWFCLSTHTADATGFH